MHTLYKIVQTIKALADLRFSKGSTIASGLVAGGAIGSLFSAVLRIAGIDVFAQDWVETPEATYLSIVMYLLLCAFLYKVAMYIKAKKHKSVKRVGITNRLLTTVLSMSLVKAVFYIGRKFFGYN